MAPQGLYSAGLSPYVGDDDSAGLPWGKSYLKGTSDQRDGSFRAFATLVLFS
jgi:hypothetical protein